jgi:hypothetical protein
VGAVHEAQQGLMAVNMCPCPSHTGQYWSYESSLIEKPLQTWAHLSLPAKECQPVPLLQYHPIQRKFVKLGPAVSACDTMLSRYQLHVRKLCMEQCHISDLRVSASTRYTANLYMESHHTCGPGRVPQQREGRPVPKSRPIPI